MNLSNRSFESWLRKVEERGAQLIQTDSEEDACAQVIRGEAEAAICSGTWARRFGLCFRLLQVEPWELAVRVDAMEDPNVCRLCSLVQSDAMRLALSKALLEDVQSIGQMRLERGVEVGPAQPITPGEALVDLGARTKQSSARWTVLLRDRPEQMLNLAEQLRGRGLRVGGFVQIPSGPACAKPLGYDLYRLSQAERVPLAERVIDEQRRAAGEHFCELSFHSSALLRAGEWLREDLGVCDLLIIDGIGRLEERGEGLFPALAWARMQERAKVIVLSSKRSHIPEVARRLSLSDTLVSELCFGNDLTAPGDVVDHIVQACGRGRRMRVVERQPE
jgi:nucleoside-triphosphatase THEP1